MAQADSRTSDHGGRLDLSPSLLQRLLGAQAQALARPSRTQSHVPSTTQLVLAGHHTMFLVDEAVCHTAGLGHSGVPLTLQLVARSNPSVVRARAVVVSCY